jgi:hypothetical protein
MKPALRFTKRTDKKRGIREAGGWILTVLRVAAAAAAGKSWSLARSLASSARRAGPDRAVSRCFPKIPPFSFSSSLQPPAVGYNNLFPPRRRMRETMMMRGERCAWLEHRNYQKELISGGENWGSWWCGLWPWWRVSVAEGV